ncbi:uncharacterized protein SCHCODRAFT_02461006, partial [Schizophyllum commune H4-8]|uniref:uncharacterized protein n=1 Tax=Schizophyllum commune (strain H4-8 / FGSC 9210) TaxID=578458 RepID=UPI00215F8A3D
WSHSLHRLAAWPLHKHQLYPHSRVLRVRQLDSRSSKVLSNGEGMNLSPPSDLTPGRAPSRTLALSTNILQSLTEYDTASTSASPPFMLHAHPLITTPSLYITIISCPSSLTSSGAIGTLALSRETSSSNVLGPSRLLPCPLYLSPTSLISYALLRIFHTLTFLDTIIFRLITLLTPATSPVPGEHSQLSRSCALTFPQAPKVPSETSARPIAASRSRHLSGRAPSCRSALASSPSTRPSPLVSPLGEEFTASSQMPASTSCARAAWDQWLDGSMTTFSSESCAATSTSTTPPEKHGSTKLSEQEADTSAAPASGTVATSRRAAASASSSRTCHSPSGTCRTHPSAAPTTPTSRTACATSTSSATSSASIGSTQRTRTSAQPLFSPGCHGTSTDSASACRISSERNTWNPFTIGSAPEFTSSRKCKNYMESCFTRRSLYPKAEPTSQISNPCWPYTITVLTCRVPLPDILRTTSTGGSAPSTSPASSGAYLGPKPSLMFAPSQTRAPRSESGSSSVNAGAHGSSVPGGSQTPATLAGQKRSASSFSFASYSGTTPAACASKYSVTTRESSTGGGTGAATTGKSTSSSAASTESLLRPQALSMPSMLRAPTTLPTSHPAASIPLPTYSSHPSKYRRLSNSTSLTTIALPPKPSLPVFGCAAHSGHTFPPQTRPRLVTTSRTSSSPTRDSGAKRHFDAPVAPPLSPTKARPRAYPSTLQLAPSILRPNCLARERLYAWHPASVCRASSDAHLDTDRIATVMANGYADGTAETYGSGLLVYHVYCDLKGVAEEDRAPAAAILISSFAASLAGSYGGGTVANYVYGVRAWHLIHGARWAMNKDELDVLLKAADKLAPPTSRRKQRQPYTIEILARVRPRFDLQVPLDAATWACLTTTFWSGARLGEFTVTNLQSFDPRVHVKPSDMSSVSDRQGNKQQKFHIPRTKANQLHGEDVFWAEQPGEIDPKLALDAHLALNTPGPNDALFSYPHGKTRARRPLTK